jgi:hypothetical protein
MSMVLMRRFSRSKWSLFQALVNSPRCGTCNAKFLQLTYMHKPLPVRVIALFVDEHVGRDLVKRFSDEFAIEEYWGVVMGDMELCGMAKDHSAKTAYNPICGISKIVRQKGGRCAR